MLIKTTMQRGWTRYESLIREIAIEDIYSRNNINEKFMSKGPFTLAIFAAISSPILNSPFDRCEWAD